VFGLMRKSTSDAARMAALDALRTNVMLADNDLNIIFVNRSLAALMQEAESDLRKELPGFEAAQLVGRNIDVFHRDPRHQRQMLATLQTQHAALIRIGQRPFDLVVTPLMQGTQRLGFSVEWADARARLLNMDYGAQIAAVRKHQAVITFDPDGVVIDVNTNFLRIMGYREADVLGRHHRMFVEPGYAESADYAAFWQELRNGKSKHARFRRLRGDGQGIWIDAAYNPIVGPDGKLEKIIKFGTDVSDQVALAENLRLLIDNNFTEIDSAIGLSTAEAGSAAAAAGATAGNVRSIAASAEQLAASIGEISQSMATSRIAMENAFEQIIAAGRNTDALANAVEAMNDIVSLIRNVASQINLLSLNATIESARAGEAGKGFAVVASEVKTLAVQASKATERISSEIEGIQATSRDVVNSLSAIRDAVTTVRDSIVVTASAVEEQSVVTRDMSATMQDAAGSVSTVSANVAEISSAVLKAADAVSRTREATVTLAA